jgi:hypothetical protein
MRKNPATIPQCRYRTWYKVLRQRPDCAKRAGNAKGGDRNGFACEKTVGRVFDSSLHPSGIRSPQPTINGLARLWSPIIPGYHRLGASCHGNI